MSNFDHVKNGKTLGKKDKAEFPEDEIKTKIQLVNKN